MKNAMVIGSMSTDFVVNTNVIPNEGETVVGEKFQTHFGGKGANQAIALSRAGTKVFMVGAIGDDVYGELLKKNLEENRIDVTALKTVENLESGSAHIQIKDGDNRIIIVPGSNDQVTVNQIKENHEIILQMDMVIIQNEIPINTIQYVIDFCFENGIQTIYNPAPVKEIGMEYIEKVTYVTPNEHEVALLFDDEDYLNSVKRYPNKLIVTLGKKGAVFFDGEHVVEVPAKKIDRVVDTTGAGDTFNGYLAHGILEGYGLKKSIELANVASSIAIQTEGAQDGIPYFSKVVHMR